MNEITNYLKELNLRIFEESEKKFDIRNIDGYIISKQEFNSIEDLVGKTNFDFENFISEDTRNLYLKLLKRISPDQSSLQKNDIKFDYIGPETRDIYKSLLEEAAKDKLLREKLKNVLEKMKNELIRDILFFGSECEEQGVINISQEYSSLENEIKNEYLKLHKSNNQTLDGLRNTWDNTKPEIIVLSCHGSEYGLFIKDENGKCKEYLNAEFAKFFKKRNDHTECVILSSCLSKNLGEIIAHDGRNVICINRKVRITEAAKYKREFFKYLNSHSLDNPDVFYNAHVYSIESLEFENSPDSFSFEFIKPFKF